MNRPGDVAIYFYSLCPPLINVVYPWFVHCERAMNQKWIFNCLNFLGPLTKSWTQRVSVDLT